MTARDEVLGRIRAALTDRPDPPPVVRDYRGAGATEGGPALELFVERVTDYRATVHRADPHVDPAAAVAAVLATRGITRVVVPDGFPEAFVPGAGGATDTAVEVVREPAGTDVLDTVGAVLTTCRVAVAETGTIVLDAGPGMGPRALTLVPDYHLVVVRADQIVPGVPDAVAALDPTRPLTWISGPSATSDIELQRVEGVHGPRTLDVVLVPAAAIA
ncbi:L-lactate dehydrogenase complex protein LldG [Jatrophihabitans endophyticus]|uniref:L-lactate dehydrogenase complex protein LldG n=1 Tax=Jatrophihabitans endophyticus TaxID=1206085 RepID=A0A1M5KL53_9ACTN|nr:LUD domain-containing protein [Jatrophihabitans endophyticus]SHG53488.1 L-lactate dehydrogenase complex protein LldG [Jatrophihabitans endophyticus]